jgi:hypothetical protein
MDAESVLGAGPLGMLAVDSRSSIDNILKAQPCETRSAEFGRPWNCRLTTQYAQ